MPFFAFAVADFLGNAVIVVVAVAVIVLVWCWLPDDDRLSAWPELPDDEEETRE